MKYVRKVTALVLSIIFFAAIIIGIGIIFSVKNVNVEFIGSGIDYSEEYAVELSSEQTRTKENLNKLKGSGMLFVSASDISSKLSNGEKFVVESYERIYPCTINVVIKERVECFAVKYSDRVDVYDEDGVFIRNVRTEGEYLNPFDNSPDIYVYTESPLVKLTDAEYRSVASLCGSIKSSFGALRKIVSDVTIYSSLKTAEINLRSGISVVIYGWESGVEEKVSAVFEVYKNLSDKEKTCGKITVANGGLGNQPTAIYG